LRPHKLVDAEKNMWDLVKIRQFCQKAYKV